MTLSIPLPKVVIVGKVNAGKSTLFNRLVRKPLAVTSKTPGVTRDRLRKPVEWAGRRFELLDTGGLYPPEEDGIFEKVAQHIEKAVEEADLVLFLVDLKSGLTPYDEEIARWLRKKGRPVLLVANKADVKNKDPEEFLALGLGQPLLISAEHGIGVPHLLDTIIRRLEEQGAFPKPKGQPETEPTERIPVAILGRPNVGKSSILNALVGEEVTIISDIPGTTRDAVDIECGPLIFIDTAGLKRKYRDDIEYFAAVRTERSLRYAQIALVVLDVTESVTRMDKRILRWVIDEGKGLVIALNKIDLIPSKERRQLYPQIQAELDFVYFAPKILTSAVTGEGIEYLKEILPRVYQEYKKRVSQRRLDAFLDEVLAIQSPGADVRRLRAKQWAPPVLVLESRDREVPGHYLRFLEKRFRDTFGFWGVPIHWESRVVPKGREKGRRK